MYKIIKEWWSVIFFVIFIFMIGHTVGFFAGRSDQREEDIRNKCITNFGAVPKNEIIGICIKYFN